MCLLNEIFQDFEKEGMTKSSLLKRKLRDGLIAVCKYLHGNKYNNYRELFSLADKGITISKWQEV